MMCMCTISSTKYLFDVSQSGIIFHEEGKVLIGHINLCITTVFLMLLLCITSTRESILCNLNNFFTRNDAKHDHELCCDFDNEEYWYLFFDLLHGVSKEN